MVLYFSASPLRYFCQTTLEQPVGISPTEMKYLALIEENHKVKIAITEGSVFYVWHRRIVFKAGADFLVIFEKGDGMLKPSRSRWTKFLGFP